MPMNNKKMRPRMLHPEAAAWRAAVIANGGSVRISTVNAVSKFCASIDAAGIRDRFYRLNLFCGNSDASLNAVRTPLYRGPSRTGTQYGNATDTNSSFVAGDYAETGASGGLKGNATTKALALGAGVLTGLTNANLHVAAYGRDMQDTNGNTEGILLGRADGGPRPFTVLRGGNNETAANQFMANEFAAGLFASPSASIEQGFLVGSTTATDYIAIYTNGQLAGSSTSSRTLANAPNNGMGVFGYQASSDGFAARSGARLSGYSIGSGMSAQQVSGYYSIMQAFQTTMGRNV